MNASEAQAMAGKRLLYTAGPIPAIVTVRDGRTVYNRRQWQVEDCEGRLRWVNADSCREVGGEGKRQ